MIIALIVIFLVSIAFSFIAYLGHAFYMPKNWSTGEGDKKIIQENAPWQWKFFEIWRFFVSFFIGGLIGYYFIAVRYSRLFFNGETPNVADFVLLFVFVSCITGFFPYLLQNITMGANKIVTKVLGG